MKIVKNDEIIKKEYFRVNVMTTLSELAKMIKDKGYEVKEKYVIRTDINVYYNYDFKTEKFINKTMDNIELVDVNKEFEFFNS